MDKNKISINDEALEAISGGYELTQNPDAPISTKHPSSDEGLSVSGTKNQNSVSDAKSAFDLARSVLDRLASQLKLLEGFVRPK